MKKLSLLLLLVSSVIFAQDRTLVINECMPNNTLTAADQDGEYNDWLELYNISNASVNLQGYFLSDRRSEPTKFQFPNVSIAAQDYLIIWVDKDSMQDGLHTNFKLSASSEQVYLFNSDTNLIDYVHFFNMQADESIARTKDGNGPFEITSPSYNSSNGNNPSGIVINEWMAFNDSAEMDEYDEYNDWIELYNNSNQAINLNGYYLSNKVTERTKYQFPNITIGAHDYLILWADQDSFQGDLHLPFKLDSERDDIILSRPDTSTIDYFSFSDALSNLSISRYPNGIGNILTSAPTQSNSNVNYVGLQDLQNGLFTLSPNPAKDHINIKHSEGVIKWTIIDINGHHLLSKNTLSQNSIDISLLSIGTYFLQLETPKGIIIKKFSKKQD